MARLDSDSVTPRRYVGNVTTRLVHRTDSEDEACVADADQKLVFGDSLERLLAQEWSAYETYEGPFLEGETPKMYNLPDSATTRPHKREVMRGFRRCGLCLGASPHPA